MNVNSCGAAFSLELRTPCKTNPPPSLRHAPSITPDDGDGDEEHTLARKRMKIQRIVAACVDTGIQNGLLQMPENPGSCGAHTRLAELGAAEVDHTWLWRPGPLKHPFPGSPLVSPVPLSPVLLDWFVSQLRACVCPQPFCVIWLFRGPRRGLTSWQCSSPRWRLSRMWLRSAFSPSWRRPQGSSHPISSAERALLVPLSRPRSRSRSPPPQAAPLHPAQSARSHWSGCQELPPSSASALGLLPSPLRLPSICCQSGPPLVATVSC